MSLISAKTAALLVFVPALATLAACNNNAANDPTAGIPQRIAAGTPQWATRFDTSANKRYCRVTDTQTGARYTQRRYGSQPINTEFSLSANRRRCTITENATGISCTSYGYSGALGNCSSVNPAYLHALSVKAAPVRLP